MAPHGLLAFLLALATAGILATPALAVRGHEFAGAFGWGVLDGKTELQRCTTEANCKPGLSGTGEGQFDHPDGIAVNETSGNVYVVDKENDRVEIFNAQGSKFEGEFDGSGIHPNEGGPAGGGGGPEEVPTGKLDEPEGIAIDNDPSSPSFEDVYVVDTNGHKGGTFEEERMVIDKFGPKGEYIGQITRNSNGEEFAEHGFQNLFGVSVDPRGEVWVAGKNFGTPIRGVANYTNEAANKWIAFRRTQNNPSTFVSPGFAVDSEDNLYVRNIDIGDRLAKFTASGTLITPEFDEEVPTDVAVEAKSDDVYVAHASNVHRLSASATSLEVLKAPGVPSFSGVTVNASTLTVYAAEAEANRVDVFAPEAPGVPRIEAGSEAVSNVSATNADFTAEVNPRSEENEAPTSYTFQYGPCESASSCPSTYPQSTPSPEGTLAPNYEPDEISAHPQDLQPHTVYHMRVVAHNSHGEATPGEELIFTTQGPPAAALPDDRQWELVSQPDKHGAILLPIQGSGVIQASLNGDAISYLANAPSESQPAGFSQTVQILSRRGSSWASQDIATAHEAAVGVSLGVGQGEYRFFSEDLESAIVQPVGPFTRSLSPQASEQTTYLRSDFPPGDPSHPCSSSCYRPLVSGCPGGEELCPSAVQEVANVPEGTKLSEAAPAEGGGCRERCGPTFLGASADASHIVLTTSKAPLAEGAPEGIEGSLYEWAGGKLGLVSVLPNELAVAPSTKPVLGYSPESSTTIRIARHTISADGSRIVFSEAAGLHHLYLRRTTGEAKTIQLDVPEAGCTAKCTGTAAPIFQTASADGSRVFFTDSQPLTQDAGDSDLYECEIEEAEEGLACKLSDLTPPGSGEEGAGVIGLIAGASEDGSAIYFTANGRLSEEASARGEEAVAGDCKANSTNATLESETAAEQCNLYMHANGQTRLIAVLSGADFPDWSRVGGLGLRGLSDRVSPDGSHLAFMSRRPLSGYDNRDASSNKPDQEVFVYDAAENTLACASCDPSGARPRGVQYRKINTDNGGLAGGGGIWPENAGIAASIPGWTALSAAEGFALHQSRYLSDSGRLFFNSADALVPEDANKSEDVYEYEPSSVGDCTSSRTGFTPSSGGCVALISSGTTKEESAFLDASESGDDVFFMTVQRLLPDQDLDAARDVYDAHACSTSSPCLPQPPTPPPACEGDACQSPGAPPEDQTPGSFTYQGPGNPAQPAATAKKAPPKTPAQIRAEKLKKALKACRAKKNKQKRTACEKHARRLYGPQKKAKKGAHKTQKSAGRKGRR